jgi:multisubunit Na+/H+ antiporter MnhF subunit
MEISMAAPLNPIASQHLPSFITAPGETDILMVVTAVILAVSILMFGILFLRLHNLPERLAHGSKKAQLEIVSVLCLIGLLTHIHAFWIAALLLAFIDFPDFSGWLGRIAAGVETMAGLRSGNAVAPSPPQETIVDTKQVEAPTTAPREAKSRAPKPKEAAHA